MYKKLKSTFIILIILICTLFSVNTNSQAVPVAKYYFNKWLYQETLLATSARRAAMNDARYWPSTAANDAAYVTLQAETIQSIQTVLRQEAANASSYVQKSNTPLSNAEQSVRLSDTLLGLNWYSLALNIGITAVDDYLTSQVVDASNSIKAIIKYSPKNTPSGVRFYRTVENVNPYRNQYSPLLAASKAISYKAFVVATSSCIVNTPCASYPAASSVNLTGYKYFTPVFDQSISQKIYTINVNYFGVSNIAAYFLNADDVISYLNSFYPYQAKTVIYYSVYDGGFTDALLTTSPPKIIHSVNYSSDYSSDYSLIIDSIDSDYNFNSLDYKYIDDGYDNFQLAYPYLDGDTALVGSIPYASPTSSLDAYGINAGKISLGASDLNATLSASTAAALLNKLWQKAASMPGYKGQPYSPTNPVTAPEIDPVYDPISNPTPNPKAVPLPKIGDLLEPLINPTTKNPTGDPYISPTPDENAPEVQNLPENQPSTSPGTKPLDLTHPDVNEPTLEKTPTAQSILDPLLNIIPQFHIGSISHVVGVCPVVTFDLDSQWGAMGGTWTINQHCIMFEDFRTMISSIFLVLFAFGSFRIVMKA
jgi:hypothetical protein